MTGSSDPSTRVIPYLTIAAFLLGLLVVVLGAYTRLVDAGLGCPDWPGCYGFLTVPQSEVDIAMANERFPEMPLEADKAWPEMVHRYAATLLGIVILAILFTAIVKKSPLAYPILLTVLVIAQGIFGAWTVTLKLWPQVVTAHLLGGFATVALLGFYLIKQKVVLPIDLPNSAYRVALIVFCVLVIQIALGGWTSSNYAALACPDFPLCHGQVIPDMAWFRGFNIFQDIGPNYLGGELSNDARIAIQFSHRLVALVLTAITIWLITRLQGNVRWLLGVVLATQFALGVSNVWFDLPLAVATLHNFGALVYLLVIVYILYFTRTRSSVG
ncbi:MAG: COX15/CtaA family protein [Gammaproteobacteria bacterium]|nr:COX15/CtaA family protein [Gammaproteobacteria bacterium]